MEGLSYVEKVDENDRPMYEVTSPKHRRKFRVVKSNDGFALFRIQVANGTTPKMLEGKYTSLEAAYKQIRQYVNQTRETPELKRKKYWEENHAPTVHTDSSE